MTSSLGRLLFFGVAAATVGGIPGIGIIMVATAIEAGYQKRKKRIAAEATG